jgi:hypothetical protein
LDADALSRQLSRRLKGVDFPAFSTVRDGRIVNGVELKFTDPARAPLVSVNFHVLDAIRRVSGRNLVREAEAAGRDFGVLDKAAGSDRWRKALSAGRSAAEIVRQWEAGEDAFERRRVPYLLYAETAPAQSGTPARAVAQGKGPSAPAAQRPNGRYREVTVQRGDTVSKLARDLGTTVSAIAEANPGLDVSKLKPGMKLRVPRG